jgi:integrase
MAKTLTAKGVDALKPDPAKRLEVPDGGMTGLYLVVQPTGGKGWAFRYRFSGKPSKLTLGRWPDVGLAEARRAAAEALEKIEAGTDPAEEKRAARPVPEEAPDRDKVKTLLALYRKRHLSTKRSGEDAYRFLERFALEPWGDRAIQSITKRDVIDLLDGIVDSGRGITANRVRAHLSTFFNWCVGRDVLAMSPMIGIKKPAKETSRDRVLSDREIRLFMAACDQVGEPWGPMGKLLLLTGQRLNEVARMTEGEIIGQDWLLPAERTKNKKAHLVPLSAAARAVLDQKIHVQNPARFIFCTNGRTPVSGFDKARATIAAKMEEIAAKEAPDADPIPHWTFHDLRRTGLARNGTPVRVTEAVLNHVSGSGGGIVGVYQRHDFADEKREALEAWARALDTITGAGVPNVVQLRAAK